MFRTVALLASLAAAPAMGQPPVPPVPPAPQTPGVPSAAEAPPVPLATPDAAPAPLRRPQRPPQVPAPPPAPGVPAPLPPPPRGLSTNVQVELTITDRMGPGDPEKKTVSLITSDASWGRIRAGANTRNPQTGPVATVLNVDARPVIVQDAKGAATNRLRLELTIEYQPIRTRVAVPSAGEDVVAPTHLNQSLSVLLTSGVPIVVSQAADPITDRQVVVEVKATVLK